MSKINIIGSGRVGYMLGSGFEQLGNKVIFYDTDKSLIYSLKEAGYQATLNLKYAVDHSYFSFICVPTFSSGYSRQSKVISTVKKLANALKDKAEYHLVVIISTVMPTTTERILIPLLLNSGKKPGKELGICVNPEFSTEITSTWTDDPSHHRGFFSQDRIVIGQFDKKSGDVLERLYKPLDKPILRTDLRTAEMIKCAANFMLATKISFWNEISLISQQLGIDSHRVSAIAALDPRIGKYGSVHGKAFGGKCLPGDLEEFIAFAQEYHYPSLLRAVKQINDYMRCNFGIRE